MKLSKYMVSGAMIGYAVGCRMEEIRRVAMRSAKRMKRLLSRKLGI